MANRVPVTMLGCSIIWGRKKEVNGDAGKPLSDARETSYMI